MKLDKKSGYITDPYNGRSSAFTPERKAMFLKLYEAEPNIKRCAKASGVDRRTVQLHLRDDAKFKADFNEIVEGHCDDSEGNIFRIGKKNWVASIAYLKAYRAARWNPGTKIEYKGKAEDVSALLDKAREQGTLIDVPNEASE